MWATRRAGRRTAGSASQVVPDAGELGAQGRRDPASEEVEVLLGEVALREPGRGVDLEQRLECAGIELESVNVERASAGSRPIGVVTASAVPSRRRMIHSSTRALSPKPGHRNDPSSPFRNQLTWKIAGAFSPSMRPIFTQ